MKYIKKLNVSNIVLLIFMLLISQDIYAQNLPLNEGEFNIIKSACPECIENDVMVCGNQNIGFGKKFDGNFFQGMPSRGFLITPPFLASNFKDLLRNEINYDNLNLIMQNRFLKLKLILINKSFENIDILTDPKVDVNIPKKLHDCLIIKKNKWGCGVSKKNEQECCEKRLGSPIVKVTWIDKINNENIELQYNPDMGSTKLIRKINNNIKVIYYCLNSESAKIK